MGVGMADTRSRPTDRRRGPRAATVTSHVNSITDTLTHARTAKRKLAAAKVQLTRRRHCSKCTYKT